MNRTLFQQIAEERVRDAEALLASGQWSGAYYVAGYAVECGLKACIAKLTLQFDFPDKDKAQRSYTHKIDVLLEVAGLVDQRKIDFQTNPDLAANWLIAKDWEETARYQLWIESEARKLLLAVTEPKNGVLPWIKGLW